MATKQRIVTSWKSLMLFMAELLYCDLRREELQCYGTFELGVLGFVDHPHASTTELLEDLVVRNRLTDEGGHDNSSEEGEHRGNWASPKAGTERRPVKELLREW
jgi:hypothetical protein